MRPSLLLLLTLVLTPLAQAAGNWTLNDQHDKAYTLADDVRVVMVARSMASARLVNSAVEHTPAGYLEARGVVFVADIEKMPSMVQAVMVPAMRSANYRILLDRSGEVAEQYGGDRDSVQWLELSHGKVTGEHRYSDLPSLRKALAGMAGRVAGG